MKSKSKEPKKVKTDGLVPPDRGYGWVIVVSYAIANVRTKKNCLSIFFISKFWFSSAVEFLSYHVGTQIYFQKQAFWALSQESFNSLYLSLNICFSSQFVGIPTTSNIGLIFKDKFDEMKIPAADLTLIININSALSMALGLINGPLLRYFGYRKISVVAAILFSMGLMLTALTDSVLGIIITYGVITGCVHISITTHVFAYDINLCGYFSDWIWTEQFIILTGVKFILHESFE